MISKNEIVLDDKTFNMLDLLANAGSEDLKELVKIVRADSQEFRQFINEAGYSDIPIAKQLVKQFDNITSKIDHPKKESIEIDAERKPNAVVDNETTSLLSKKLVFEGIIHGDGDLNVEGPFKGRIKTTGNIFVAQSAVVEAEIEANNVVIQGKITGNVIAHKKIEIQSSGQLTGECVAQSLDINDGAILTGTVTMRKSAEDLGSSSSSSASVTSGEKDRGKVERRA